MVGEVFEVCSTLLVYREFGDMLSDFRWQAYMLMLHLTSFLYDLFDSLGPQAAWDPQAAWMFVAGKFVGKPKYTCSFRGGFGR